MKVLKNKKTGFTLIELLVVVAIISLLSSVVMSNLSEARKKSEYQAFASQVVQIRNALQTYGVDHNGVYPERSDGLGGTMFLTDVISILYTQGYLAENISLPEISGGTSYFWRGGGGNVTGCGGVLNISSGGWIMYFNNGFLKDYVPGLFDDFYIGNLGVIQPYYACIMQN